MGDLRELHGLALGFSDPVADAQGTFRAALRALAHPGEPVPCPPQTPEVVGLMPATVALALALTDHETAVWWARGEPARWLRFHTGAPVAEQPADAQFAVVAQPLPAPDIALFCAGTDESPERSATLLIELPALAGGPAAVWSGPGLREPRSVYLAGVPDHFWAQWHDNHARFPSGVDVFFISGRDIVGLPRTTRVQAVGGCE